MDKPNDTPRREDFAFVHRLRVRWAETDPQGVVFNANYYLYFDVAITEYWRAIGLRYPADLVEGFGSDLFAIASSARFFAPACYDEEIDIGCRAARLGRTSATFALAIWRDGVPLTSGEITYVNANAATRKPMPMPALVVDKIMAFEARQPDTKS